MIWIFLNLGVNYFLMQYVESLLGRHDLFRRSRTQESEQIPSGEPVFLPPIPPKEYEYKGSQSSLYPNIPGLSESSRMMAEKTPHLFLDSINFTPIHDPFCHVVESDWSDVAEYSLSKKKVYCTKVSSVSICFPDTGNLNNDEKVTLFDCQPLLIKNQKHPDDMHTGRTFGYGSGLCKVEDTLYVTTGLFKGGFVLIARPLFLHDQEKIETLKKLLS